MADISDVAAALESILSVLTDVDAHSTDHYAPMIETQRVALLIVPFEQEGVMVYTGTGKHSVAHAHRIACEFWIKGSNNNSNAAAMMQRGRDICLKAMRLLAANPTLNGTVLQLGSAYNGTLGQIGTYRVEVRFEERGRIDWIIARLFVPVEIRETAQW